MISKEIIVHSDNESYIQIETEPSIEKDLWEYFTITIPNATYRRTQYKKWNGQIRLYNLRKHTLYKGLLPFVEEFAKINNYKFQSLLRRPTPVSTEHILKFIASLKLSNKDGSLVRLHKHQLQSLIHIFKTKRCLLLVPTGGGKSLITYTIIRYLLDVEQIKKIYIVVPTTNLCTQLYTDFQDYSVCNGWDASTHCHLIFAGADKVTSKPVVISTWQSLQNVDPDTLDCAGAILVEESHTATASVLKSLVGACTKASWKVGSTGTINDVDSKCHTTVLQGLFGLIYQPTSTYDLIQKQILSPLKIKCVLIDHQGAYLPISYDDEKNYIVTHVDRNNFICNLGLSQKTNTLILFDLVQKQGKVLFELMKVKNPHADRKIFFISGEVPAEAREEIRHITEKEQDAIIIASYQCFQLGVNIKNLHNIIFASPSKSKIRVLQSIGRELRIHDEKIHATLFDISDDLRNKTYKNIDNVMKLNYTLSHFIARLKIYDQEKFDYEIFRVKI